MTNTLFRAISVAVFCGAGVAVAQPACSPMADTAIALPLDYLDRADPIIARVSEALEADLITAQVNGSAPGPLQKLYCDIGMFDLIIRFVQPAEDDAIIATVTEAQYVWDPAQDPAGWMLSGLRRQPMCARGNDPFAAVCP